MRPTQAARRLPATTSAAALGIAASIAVLAVAPSAVADTYEAWDAYDRGDYSSAYELFLPEAQAGDADAQYGMGLLLSDGLGVKQDRAAAVEWLEQSALLGNDQAMVNLGFHIDLGLGHPRDPDLAEYWYEQAAELGNLMALNNLAYLWALQNRNLDQALASMQDLVELVPEESSYLDTLGWVLYQRGEYAESVRFICEAVILEPGHPELRLHLGDAYWQMGRAFDAQHQWQRAMRLLEEPQALSDNGADFAEGLGLMLAGEVQRRLTEGLPAPQAVPDNVDDPLPGIPDECSVPVV